MSAIRSPTVSKIKTDTHIPCVLIFFFLIFLFVDSLFIPEMHAQTGNNSTNLFNFGGGGGSMTTALPPANNNNNAGGIGGNFGGGGGANAGPSNPGVDGTGNAVYRRKLNNLGYLTAKKNKKTNS